MLGTIITMGIFMLVFSLSIGMVLGRFHCDALGSKSLPNDERQWNGRLKQLEEKGDPMPAEKQQALDIATS